MYKCCIFDLDGTLVDSIKAINHTINLTLSKYNLGPIDEENCKVFVGDGYKKLVERALIHFQLIQITLKYTVCIM